MFANQMTGDEPRSQHRSNSSSKYTKLRKLEGIFLIMITIFLLLEMSMFTNVFSGFDLLSSSTIPLKEKKDIYKNVGKVIKQKQAKVKQEQEIGGEKADKKNVHKLGGLSCAAHGGPSDEIAAEMVYWRDIPQDSDYISPFKHKKKDGPVQYMTFEPDEGGWNNIRYVCLIYVSLY